MITYDDRMFNTNAQGVQLMKPFQRILQSNNMINNLTDNERGGG